MDVGFGDSFRTFITWIRATSSSRNALVSHRRRQQSLRSFSAAITAVIGYPNIASPCNPTHSPITNRCATSTRPLPNPTSPKPLLLPRNRGRRITLTGLRLITTSAQQRLEDPLADRDSFDHILRDQFGIVMKNRVR